MKMQSRSKSESNNLSAYHCPECAAGVMHMEAITYFTWLNKELVTVPNFPAWVCDMCGRREFDSRAVTWLNTLLNPAAGRSSRQKSRRDPGVSSADQPQTYKRAD
ncbi:MAG: YgiT-type zinc finger protein [Chloroflexota bacterium]|nr:MAG: YgiT-type zinc finger protein [Chloroflexota bacterium]